MEATRRPTFRTPRGGDHDQPFEGFQPTHFTLLQLARLLILRGRVQEAKLGADALSDDLRVAR
jgi:hypothetical protein